MLRLLLPVCAVLAAASAFGYNAGGYGYLNPMAAMYGYGPGYGHHGKLGPKNNNQRGQCSGCSDVSTYNTALTSATARYAERRDLVGPALKTESADVYCLQGVYLESDEKRILDSLNSSYSHSYSAIHYAEGELRKPYSKMFPNEQAETDALVEAACNQQDFVWFFGAVGPCALTSGCTIIFGTQGYQAGWQCVSNNCAAQLNDERIRPQCLSCIYIQQSSFTAISPLCLPDAAGDRLNKLNDPGLLLVSKCPITNAKYTPFFPGNDQLIQRGYIEADVEGVGKVVCTNLDAADAIYTEYDMPFTNFADQQAAEITQLLQRFRSKDHILMGTLNAGPGEASLGAVQEDQYNRLIDSGYASAYLKQSKGCTYCTDNALIPVSQRPAQDQVIDNILIRGKTPTVRSSRRTLTGNLDNNINPLSTHYGAEATVCPAETCRGPFCQMNKMGYKPYFPGYMPAYGYGYGYQTPYYGYGYGGYAGYGGYYGNAYQYY